MSIEKSRGVKRSSRASHHTMLSFFSCRSFHWCWARGRLVCAVLSCLHSGSRGHKCCRKSAVARCSPHFSSARLFFSQRNRHQHRHLSPGRNNDGAPYRSPDPASSRPISVRIMNSTELLNHFLLPYTSYHDFPALPPPSLHSSGGM